MSNGPVQRGFEWPSYLNKGLFADHFLDSRLPEMPEWNEDAEVRGAFERVVTIFDEIATRFTRRTNESQTERGFIQPVLDTLWGDRRPGDVYQVQVRLPAADQQRQPDYAFFSTAEEREHAEPQVGTADYWLRVAVLGDAKKWSASLDRDASLGENPSAQICNYLYRANVQWGILTNGRIWRLYERDRSRAGGVYFEVDLERIIAQRNQHGFKFFYKFFSRQAFTPGQGGLRFVDKVLQGSDEHATRVGQRLKESVYDALRILLNGFLAFPQNNLTVDDLEYVHSQSLIVLYRLLFMLYAEDKKLLPLDNRLYESICLRSIHRRINAQVREGNDFHAQTTLFWRQFLDLCRLIDLGDPAHGITQYNGGLFSPAKHPNIAYTPVDGDRQWQIGDEYFAKVINLLAYDRSVWNEPGDRDIDYVTLGVEHLGSVYEGLLELRPQVAEHLLVEALVSNRIVFTPPEEGAERAIRGQPPRTIAQGEVYLVTDTGERRSTGSYYTPKTVVDYIVETALNQLCDQAATKVAAIHRENETRLAELLVQLVPNDEPFHLSAIENPELREEIARIREDYLNPYLSLRILDPALGSGHFLVGAADFISLSMASDPKLPHLLAEGDPQSYYKQMVVERCLFGVDLNPLAVELAKLSLWLHTVSRNNALSFLDHHLRNGNALIGVKINNLRQQPPGLAGGDGRRRGAARQLAFGYEEIITPNELREILGRFRSLALLPSGDPVSEHEKQRLFVQADELRNRLRCAANCWLAPQFGVAMTVAAYEAVIQALHAPEDAWEELCGQEWFREAQTAASIKGYGFFHWEIEFPEAFFSADGPLAEESAGFHAVVGNPPYVNAIELNRALTEFEKPYWKQGFASAQKAYDLYVLFLEASVKLTVPGRLSVLITPNKFLSAPYATAFRETSVHRSKLVSMRDYSRVRVFEDPSVYPIVTAFERSEEPGEYEIAVERCSGDADNPRVNRIVHSSARLSMLPESIWGFLISDYFELILHAEHRSNRLSTCAAVNASSTAGEAESYIDAITEEQGPSSLKCVNTGTIERHGTLWGTEPLTHQHQNFSHPYLDVRHPSVPETRRRQYEQPKIIFAKLVNRIEAFLDGDGRYASMNTNFVYDSRYDLHYLNAVLNSQLMTVLYKGYFGALIMSGEYFQVQSPQLRVLPIRHIEFATNADQREELRRVAQGLCKAMEVNQDKGPIAAFAAEQQNANRLDVIHDLLAEISQRLMGFHALVQDEVQGFLAWLEREAGASIAELSNRSKIRSYYVESAESLLSVLRRNERRITANPRGREFQELFIDEYERSMRHLRPILLSINTFDETIDEVVNLLYELTDRQIQQVADYFTGGVAEDDAATEPAA